MPQEEVELEEMRDADEDVAADAPLIGSEDNYQEHAAKSPTQTQSSLRTAGRVIWLLTFSAGISGLLFGYDTGVISSTLVSIGSDLDQRPLTIADKSLITAITSLFACVFAPVTGFLADKYGRRFVILCASVLFVVGAVLQALAGSVPVMAAGRAVVGTAIGMASCATPLYITELAPAGMRGRMVTIQSLFITGGQVVAYGIGWLFESTPSGWRWMVGLGAVPAVAQLCLLTLMFETPRHLVKIGQMTRGRLVLHKVYAGLPDSERQSTVETVLQRIRAELDEESKSGDDDSSHVHDHFRPPGFGSTAKSLFRTPGNRRALSIACMLQALQQLCGFNSLMYFSATIFALVGYTSPIGISLSVATTNFLFTLLAFAYIDTVGRRKILLRSIPFMILGLLACSVAFFFIHIMRAGVDHATSWDLFRAKQGAWPSVLLLSMLLYVAAYAIGLGCVPWQQSELFPLRVRSLGSALATATNWSSNFVIGVSFLPLMEVLGPSPTFLLYGLVCAVGWAGIWKIYPETAGVELEGIGELLSDGWGVEESVKCFKARKEAAAKAAGETR